VKAQFEDGGLSAANYTFAGLRSPNGMKKDGGRENVVTAIAFRLATLFICEIRGRKTFERPRIHHCNEAEHLLTKLVGPTVYP
jgi:hypothetical protein